MLRSGFVILLSLMSRLDQYLEAAQRENTRLSYPSALRHFEVEWGGFLPATSDSVARYLADYGGKLASSSLRHRLAALSRWHADHGFVDPTKAPLVRQVLKGMRHFNADGTEYELAIPVVSKDALNETLHGVIEAMYQISDDNHCGLETSFHEPATNTIWD